jgi:hypothetical protein
MEWQHNGKNVFSWANIGSSEDVVLPPHNQAIK